MSNVPKPPKPDLSRPPAYRILVKFDPNHHRQHNQIIAKYETAEEVWKSNFIRQYFNSFGISETVYYKQYHEKVLSCGFYHLSNLYSICYCEFTRKGSVRLLKPTL